MTSQTIAKADVPAEYTGLGGRGLTSIMINNEVPATCDPLGPENKLIIAPGYLSGTVLVNTSRLSIGAKSPQEIALSIMAEIVQEWHHQY